MDFQITGLPEADVVLDDSPFAVVLGMMLDQQYGMEHAFREWRSRGWEPLIFLESVLNSREVRGE